MPAARLPRLSAIIPYLPLRCSRSGHISRFSFCVSATLKLTSILFHLLFYVFNSSICLLALTLVLSIRQPQTCPPHNRHMSLSFHPMVLNSLSVGRVPVSPDRSKECWTLQVSLPFPRMTFRREIVHPGRLRLNPRLRPRENINLKKRMPMGGGFGRYRKEED